ncbi:MAG: MarR family transcriptional regulator [Bacillota bacterium]|nr:MarR family transcriptional regulator [Bacillota bacterium]
MKQFNKTFEVHSFYNLSRYLFLRIEQNYSKVIEKSGITLPQLRILWIINCFPGTSFTEAAKIGCWTGPTVTNMIKILINKNLLIIKNNSNNKTKNVFLTEQGNNIININKQRKGSTFPLSNLIHILSKDELTYLVNFYKYLSISSNNLLIFDYINKINEFSVKIDYNSYTDEESSILKDLVCYYNLLRIFVLTTENNHSLLLKELNLTYAQLRALKIIKAYEALTSKQLSEMALWSPSTANLVVKNLLSKGLIYKKKGLLKNSINIFITDKGKDIINNDYADNSNRIETLNILDNVSSEKLTYLNILLYSLNYALKNTMINDYILKTFENKLSSVTKFQ